MPSPCSGASEMTGSSRSLVNRKELSHCWISPSVSEEYHSVIRLNTLASRPRGKRQRARTAMDFPFSIRGKPFSDPSQYTGHLRDKSQGTRTLLDFPFCISEKLFSDPSQSINSENPETRLKALGEQWISSSLSEGNHSVIRLNTLVLPEARVKELGHCWISPSVSKGTHSVILPNTLAISGKREGQESRN